MPPTKKTEPEPPVDDQVDELVDEAATSRIAAGTVVRQPEHHGRYAVVVGYTDPVLAHTVTDPHTGRQVQVDAVPYGHPLLLDLPGTPREHQSGIERL